MAAITEDVEQNSLVQELIHCGWERKTHRNEVYYYPPGLNRPAPQRPHFHLFSEDEGGYPRGGVGQGILGGRHGKSRQRLENDLAVLYQWYNANQEAQAQEAVLCLILKWINAINARGGTTYVPPGGDEGVVAQYMTAQQDAQKKHLKRMKNAADLKSERAAESDTALRKSNEARGKKFLEMSTGAEKFGGEAGAINKYRNNTKKIEELLKRNTDRMSTGQTTVFNANNTRKLKEMKNTRRQALKEEEEQLELVEQERGIARLERLAQADVEEATRVQAAKQAERESRGMTVQDALDGISDRKLQQYYRELQVFAQVTDFTTSKHTVLEKKILKKLRIFNTKLMEIHQAIPNQFENINNLIMEISSRMQEIQWHNKKNTIQKAINRGATGTDRGRGEELERFVGDLRHKINDLIPLIRAEINRRPGMVNVGGRRTRRRRKHRKKHTIKKRHKKKKLKKKRTIKKRHKKRKHKKRTRKH